MEAPEKKHVYIEKKLTDFKCPVCKRMVFAAIGKEWIIETDTKVIHTWDYGHQHKRVFEVMNNQQFPIEDTLDYDNF